MASIFTNASHQNTTDVTADCTEYWNTSEKGISRCIDGFHAMEIKDY